MIDQGERKAEHGGRRRSGADALAAELRTVLTDARTFTAMLGLDLPHIDALLARASSGRRRLPEHLQEAIAGLADRLGVVPTLVAPSIQLARRAGDG